MFVNEGKISGLVIRKVLRKARTILRCLDSRGLGEIFPERLARAPKTRSASKIALDLVFGVRDVTPTLFRRAERKQAVQNWSCSIPRIILHMYGPFRASISKFDTLSRKGLENLSQIAVFIASGLKLISFESSRSAASVWFAAWCPLALVSRDHHQLLFIVAAAHVLKRGRRECSCHREPAVNSCNSSSSTRSSVHLQ